MGKRPVAAHAFRVFSLGQCELWRTQGTKRYTAFCLHMSKRQSKKTDLFSSATSLFICSLH